MNAQLNKFLKKLCFYLMEPALAVAFLGATIFLFIFIFKPENPKLLNSLKLIPLNFQFTTIISFIAILILLIIIYYYFINKIYINKLLRNPNYFRNTFKRSLFIIQITSIIVSSFLFFFQQSLKSTVLNLIDYKIYFVVTSQEKRCEAIELLLEMDKYLEKEVEEGIIDEGYSISDWREETKQDLELKSNNELSRMLYSKMDTIRKDFWYALTLLYAAVIIIICFIYTYIGQNILDRWIFQNQINSKM